MKRLSIVIPILNEVRTLKTLLTQVADAPLPEGLTRELVIVDNGSTDGSIAISENFVKDYSLNHTGAAKLFHCPTPGKGSAVRHGFKQLTGDIVLIQDGDLEYDVSDYGALLQPILDGKTDFVLGSRHLSAGGWKIRHFESRPFRSFLLNLGGAFFHGFFNTLYGVKLTDPTTMFKVFTRKSIEGLNFTAHRFDFDYELLGKLIRSGKVPLEVPVSYDSRDFTEGKKIRVLVDPWGWLWGIVYFRFSPLHEKAQAELSLERPLTNDL